MKRKTDRSSNVIKLAVIGTTLAGMAATAYFFFGPRGKVHRKHTKAWAIKMKGDVVEKLEKIHHVSEPIYHEIIDSVAAEYKKGMRASQKEINSLAQDLKRHWKTISRSVKTIKHDVKKGAKRVAKKAQR